MRQRNISTVYQAWLTASPANQCDLGDFPPLPRDAVDILLRICGPSFDLPARVTGSATIRAMASVLHFGETLTHPSFSSIYWIMLSIFVVSSTSPSPSIVYLGRC